MSNFPELTWSYDSSYELYTPDLFSSRLACFVGSSSGCCIYLTRKETELNTCQAATLPPKFPERMGIRNPRERDRIIQCIKLKCVYNAPLPTGNPISNRNVRNPLWLSPPRSTHKEYLTELHGKETYNWHTWTLSRGTSALNLPLEGGWTTLSVNHSFIQNELAEEVPL